MDTVILDTNIVSFVMKGHPLAGKYRRHFEGKTLAISFMTVGELFKGAYWDGWGQKRLDGLRETIKGYLVIPYSPSVCETWGRVLAERKHETIEGSDAWIAATALVHGCPLVTNNPAHFGGISGLAVITEP